MAEAENLNIVDIEEMIERSVTRERRADEKNAFRERHAAAEAALRAKRAEVEERAAVRRAAGNPAEAAGGNGGPGLEMPPSYDALERIGRVVYGDHWEGKLAADIGESDRTVRRWRAGEAATTPEAMAAARLWAIETAAGLLAAAGEEDLAGEVRAREQSMRLRNAERAAARHAANVAKAKAAADAKAKG